jgi:hypothetical protein
MNRLRRAVITGAVAVLSAFWIFAGSAEATVLINESYPGTDGTPLSEAGLGWYLSTGSGTAEIDTPGLSVPGCGSSGLSLYMSHASSGDFIYQNSNTSWSVNAFYASAMFRTTSTSTLTSGSWLRVEFPMKRYGDDYYERNSYFGLYNNNGTLQLRAAIQDFYGYTSVTLGTYTPGATVQIAIRYVYHNSSIDTVTMSYAVNPQGCTEPTWTLVGTTDSNPYGDGYYVHRVQVNADRGSSGTASGWIDEIRAADSYNQIVLLPGDFAPTDFDVDGSDLAALIANASLIDIATFAQNFGKNICQ